MAKVQLSELDFMTDLNGIVTELNKFCTKTDELKCTVLFYLLKLELYTMNDMDNFNEIEAIWNNTKCKPYSVNNLGSESIIFKNRNQFSSELTKLPSASALSSVNNHSDEMMVMIDIKSERNDPLYEQNYDMANKLHSCGICDKTFHENKYLLAHMKNHHLEFGDKKKKYCCEICVEDYPERSLLNFHYKNFHREFWTKELKMEDEKCEKDSQQSKRDDEMCDDILDPLPLYSYDQIGEVTFQENEDLPTDQNCIVYPCDLCLKEFPNAESLKLHYESHSENLVQHVKLHHKEDKRDKQKDTNTKMSISLDSGDMEFDPNSHDGESDTEENLDCSKELKVICVNEHRDIFQGYIFKCMYCSDEFAILKDYIDHMKFTHDKKSTLCIPFKCNTCGEEIYNRVKFKRHLWKHEEHRFFCPLCDRSTVEKFDMQKHLRKFHGNGSNQTNQPKKQIKLEVRKGSEDTSKTTTDTVNLIVNTEADAQFKHYLFTCRVCKEQFNNKKDFTCHMIKAHNKREGAIRFPCDKCSKEFNEFFKLKRHYGCHFTKKKLTCSVCEKGFRDNTDFQRHKLTHARDRRKYNCLRCARKFVKQTSLKQHMLVHRREESRPCTSCGKSFMSQTALEFHDCVSNKSMFVKETSGTSTRKLANDNEHVEEIDRYIIELNHGAHSFQLGSSDPFHNSIDDFFNHVYCCSYCTEKFQDATKYQDHMTDNHNINKNEIPYKCSICSKLLYSHYALKRHIYRVHGPPKAKCGGCQKTFRDKTELRNHIKRKHLRKKDFMCDECGKACSHKTELMLHQKTHLEPHPFQCELCTMKFRTKSILDGHMLNHHGESSPTPCPACNKIYPSDVKLRHHMRKVHKVKCKNTDTERSMDEMFNKCDICGLMLSTAEELVKHRNEHAPFYPYHCSMCDKMFNQRTSLMNHERSHSREPCFVCYICGETHINQSLYTRHVKAHEDSVDD